MEAEEARIAIRPLHAVAPRQYSRGLHASHALSLRASLSPFAPCARSMPETRGKSLETIERELMSGAGATKRG
eukprot:5899694-Pleurochrysis_carterae.AAC.1